MNEKGKQVRYRAEHTTVSWLYKLLGLLYGAGLVYIFFLARRRWRVFPKRIVNFIPFRDKICYLHAYPARLNPYNLEFYKDLVGNILLFVPFPFVLYYLFGVRRYRTILLIAAGCSLAVEIIQYSFNIGVADVDDLLLNTAGACMGLGVLYICSRIQNRRSSTGPFHYGKPFNNIQPYQ